MKNNRNLILKLFKDKELLIILVLLVIFFSTTSEQFLSVSNVNNILMNVSITGIMTLGLTLIMINGDFDLSFASALGLINLINLMLIDARFNIYLVFAFAILLGIVWEGINGFLVVKIGIPPFVATIATWNICKGIIYLLGKATTFYGYYPESMTIIGRGRIGVLIPVSTIIFIVAAIIMYLLVNRSKFGRYAYAVGSNPIAAEYVGIKSSRIRFFSYLIDGALIGVASIILSTKLCSASPAAGEAFQMTCIASAFLGATVFKPGLNNISGSILAIFLLSIIENGLVMVGAPFYYRYIVQGLIIIGAETFINIQSIQSKKQQ